MHLCDQFFVKKKVHHVVGREVSLRTELAVLQLALLDGFVHAANRKSSEHRSNSLAVAAAGDGLPKLDVPMIVLFVWHKVGTNQGHGSHLGQQSYLDNYKISF